MTMYEAVEARKMITELKDEHRLFVGRVCSKLNERGFTVEEIADITGLKESAIRAVVLKENNEETEEREEGTEKKYSGRYPWGS